MKQITSNSNAIKHLMNVDDQLAKVIQTIGPISYSLHRDGFSFLVHEIIEQMLSKKSGAIIYSRLQNLCNYQITPYSISILSEADLNSVGISRRKARYIKSLAEDVISSKIDLTLLPDMSDIEAINKLLNLRGVGMWTAKMYLIFVLDREDILPYEDGAFIQVFKWLYSTEDISKSNIEHICRKWSPYSSIAARYFYKALDSGLTKQNISTS